MKKLLPLLLGIIFLANAWAQAPQGFSYQAVVRNASGEILANQTVNFRLSITSNDGLTTHYAETSTTATTLQGVANLVIGEGSIVLGVFANIPWKSGNLNLKVEVDPAGGTAFAEMGTVPLKSVPYALYAPSTGEVASNPEALDEDPIFVVRNKLGDIVFAVYQSGVRMYVDESTTKNARGGFAIGGIGDNLKVGTEYFRVTPDSVRVNLREPVGKNVRGGFAIGGIGDNLKAQPSNLFYIGQDSARIYIDTTTSTKNVRGGFAIGGIGDNLKGKGAELMRVTRDSTRVYVNNSPTKNARGGFAIGGIGDNLKEQPSNFMFLTPVNYFIGHQAGKSITSGKYNSFIGFENGISNTTGYKNYFIGYRAGYSNSDGYSNIFIGDSAGFANTSGRKNVFIGNQSGISNTIGNFNTAVGYGTLLSNTTGSLNSAFGDWALTNNTEGIYNTAIGRATMIANTTGSLNTAVGSSALGMNTTAHFNTAFGAGTLTWLAAGNGNTAIGSSALTNITFGINNTAIGYNSFQASSDIGNSTAIGADAQVTLSNQVQIGGATVQLIGGPVAWSVVSDGRFKNISEEEVKGLDFITRLNPIIYNFDTQKYDEFLLKNLPKEKRNEIISKKDYSQSKAVVHSGFIAQEVERAAKESGFNFNGVHHPENENDNYRVAYSLFTVPLVKAVQELNEKNEKQQILINTLINETEILKAELEAIKAMLLK